MKRKNILTLTIILATVLVLIVLLTKNFQSEITINSPVSADKTAQHILQDSSLTIKELNPYTYLLRIRNRNQQEQLVRLLIQPKIQKPSTSQLRFQYFKKGIQFILPSKNDPVNLLAERMNSYLINTELLYGYKIERTTVQDTTYLFKTILVPTDSLLSKMNLVYDSLIQYAAEKKLSYRGVRIFNIYRMDSNYSQLNASISIHTPLTETLPTGIEFKQMPYKKNLLVAAFKGRFNQLNLAFEALERYKTDYDLVNMAIPYAELPVDVTIQSDNQEVELRVYYPYF
ncbi:hypothetical protein [Flavihumibacter sp. UBA7668]|uniref:hypothetical protein n=1 Tax=Flavihumibacter sp. UBA7668 TaxID=1946542 RepID=UPI0025C3E219|nr:hypothetical protein [Flavihumibacter sp. UBA7668]